MPRPEVIAIHAPLTDALLARVTQIAPQSEVVGPAQLKESPDVLHRADVLFTHLIKAERLHAASSLRWIQTMGAGVEWLLTPELKQRTELTVTNASGVHGDPISEHVFSLMLAFARRLPRVLELQREQRWDNASFLLDTPTLADATLGILGVGSIGLRIAEIATAFRMRVLGVRRGAKAATYVEHMYGPDELHRFLGQVDYVVNALPLTDETRGLLGPAEFAAMRRNAVLINIGRGGTVQTDALMAALRDGQIAGAGLDVTDPEPLPPEHPLWRVDNVIITPHFSGGRPGYIERVTDIFLDNLRKYQKGQPLTNVVNIHAGY